jgi:hypothetical protein
VRLPSVLCYSDVEVLVPPMWGQGFSGKWAHLHFYSQKECSFPVNVLSTPCHKSTYNCLLNQTQLCCFWPLYVKKKGSEFEEYRDCHRDRQLTACLPSPMHAYLIVPHTSKSSALVFTGHDRGSHWRAPVSGMSLPGRLSYLHFEVFFRNWEQSHNRAWLTWHQSWTELGCSPSLYK